jgi:large subunit ribosomal protein L13
LRTWRGTFFGETRRRRLTLAEIDFSIGNVTVKSFLAKAHETNPNWLLIDAKGQSVGRLAVKVATILMGKHKPTYTPHVDCGDCIVVLNTRGLRFGTEPIAHDKLEHFTNKATKKTYARWSGYPGGRKLISAEQMLVQHPEEVLRLAVRRMLPKSKLGRAMLKKLKLFPGDTHPHQSQKPVPYTV